MMPENVVWIHPDAARRQGLSSGAYVVLVNQDGVRSERVRVRVPRQPYPLFGLLAERGYTYESVAVRRGEDCVYDVVITRGLPHAP